MLIGLESTIAEVRNVKKARKILDEYYIEGVEFAIDDKKNMRALVVEDTWCDLHFTDGAVQHQFPRKFHFK